MEGYLITGIQSENTLPGFDLSQNSTIGNAETIEGHRDFCYS